MKQFAAALLIVTAALLAVELGLRWLDPWGMVYFDDVSRIGRAMLIDDPARGFGMADGVYVDAHSTATVVDGKRVTPDTQPAACSLAFLGDSITFGHGVNDDETFVNLIARDLPGVEVINYAVQRYNTEHVARTYAAYPNHNAYIYVIFSNDGEPTRQPSMGAETTQHQTSWMVLYMKFVLRRFEGAGPIDTARVHRDMDMMQAAGVYFVAFEDDLMANALEGGYPLHIVPFPDHPISWADFHLNAQGHRELAASLLPLARDITAQAC